jgi:hypothetical protein
MSVCQRDDGTIFLEGDCHVEDAQALLRLVEAAPTSSLDWTRCTYLHTAVLQVILAVQPTRIGPCGDGWIQRWVASR